MKSKVTRVALLATLAFAVCGLIAGSALAQSTPALTLAGNVGAEVATLTGAVDTGSLVNGVASEGTACYTVEYDTVADFGTFATPGLGETEQFTPPVCTLTPGSGIQLVQATIGCFPANSCIGFTLALTPGTEYQAVIYVSYPVTGTAAAVQVNSPELTFTTKALGTLTVGSPTLAVKGNKASVKLVCASSQPCKGALHLSSAMNGKSVVCASTTPSLVANSSKLVEVSLSSRCKAALMANKSQSISGHVSLTVTTDQKAKLSTPVKLLLS